MTLVAMAPARKRNHRSSSSGRSFWTSTTAIVAAATILLSAILSLEPVSDRVDDWWRQIIGRGAVHPPVRSLWNFVCYKTSAFCHTEALVPVGRSFQTTQYVTAGTKLMEIPRELQVWDLDAMRHEDIRPLLSARHASTGNALDAGAFLAVFLVISKKILPGRRRLSLLDRRFLDALPSQDDFQFHPTLWPESKVRELFPDHMAAFPYVQTFRDSLDSEYQALSKHSENEALMGISLDDYKTARVAVLTRTFGTAQLGPNDALPDVTLEDELGLYLTKAGVDLSQGIHAMAFLVDMMNHHANSNADWNYNARKSAFVLTTKKDIAPGQEVMISYGIFTDSYLVAKYGFVNGDGSLPTKANIAIWHRILDQGMGDHFSYLPSKTLTPSAIDLLTAQRFALLRYLQFDDGYEECIQNDKHPEAFEFKRLKHIHIARMANDLKWWSATLPPRQKDSQPGSSTRAPVTLKAPEFDEIPRIHAYRIFATCRLLALTHTDYDGQVVTILKKGLDQPDFALEEELSKLTHTTDAQLESRTVGYLMRLVDIAISKFDRTVSEELQYVERLNQESFGSREWVAAHTRLGEMQSLEAIQIALSRMPGANEPRRKKHCPMEYSEELLKE